MRKLGIVSEKKKYFTHAAEEDDAVLAAHAHVGHAPIYIYMS